MFNLFILSFIFFVALNSFYYYFKSEWPELYFGKNDIQYHVVQGSIGRIVTFRIIPIFVISIITGGIFTKVTGNIEITKQALLVGGLFFAFFKHGKALIQIFYNNGIVIMINKTTQILSHIFFFFLSILFVYIASNFINYPIIQELLPNKASIIENFWGSTSTIILGFFLYKLYTFAINSSLNMNQFFRKRRDKLGSKELEYTKVINEYSHKYNASPSLVYATLLVEDLQRPKLLRLIENIFRSKKGTYGIMQVSSKKPIQDIDSIKIAIEKYFKETNYIDSIDYTNTSTSFYNIIKDYNPNPNYCQLVDLARNQILNDKPKNFN